MSAVELRSKLSELDPEYQVIAIRAAPLVEKAEEIAKEQDAAEKLSSRRRFLKQSAGLAGRAAMPNVAGALGSLAVRGIGEAAGSQAASPSAVFLEALHQLTRSLKKEAIENRPADLEEARGMLRDRQAYTKELLAKLTPERRALAESFIDKGDADGLGEASAGLPEPDRGALWMISRNMLAEDYHNESIANLEALISGARHEDPEVSVESVLGSEMPSTPLRREFYKNLRASPEAMKAYQDYAQRLSGRQKMRTVVPEHFKNVGNSAGAYWNYIDQPLRQIGIPEEQISKLAEDLDPFSVAADTERFHEWIYNLPAEERSKIPPAFLKILEEEDW